MTISPEGMLSLWRTSEIKERRLTNDDERSVSMVGRAKVQIETLRFLQTIRPDEPSQHESIL
ncbi:MAG TPA: hypothetical protein VF899_05350 [Pyrinomonadaceae bacterium]